ncbi:hemerythrin domain-containing protein [Nonomuraea dietziae]|uniref:Hemerythrin-like domain-containing protein n=1 Tax=Nonomuraea dietziae TaxID=65515 RepID=A0A7W5VFP7_9ACTN|nr:hemerythrin domain-containing protein [Nonomuraea dietziae]MBB3730789.1 hemerythrin-like domain-containing protein [Nonomuraea dietziae]
MQPRIEPTGRLAAFGTQLIEVHHWLREELSRLRDNVDAFLDGEGRRPRELRAHCLTFCSALERHHTGEDQNAFPTLAEEFPALRPTLEKLQEDHHLVAGILRRIEALVGDLDADLDENEAERVRRELDGLSAIVESHFSFEERQIVEALNSLNDPEWERSKPDFLKMSGQRPA